MEYKKIKEITKKDIGKQYYLIAQIKAIRQTTNNFIIDLKDDTGIIKAILIKINNEISNLLIRNYIKAKILVKETLNNLEVEILDYLYIDQDIENKNQEEDKNIYQKSFLIKSEKLEKLRPLFIAAKDLIKKAILNNRPIIIRHHDDVDGYVSGIMLEKAILPLIKEINRDRYYLFFSRISSRTPYYDYTDALRDLNNYLDAKEKYNEKNPLIILCDLGSNNQSINSIIRLKNYEIDFIIIDHHRYDEENKNRVNVFLNPQIFDFGSDLSAGALCTELAFFINPSLEIEKFKNMPSLANTADKCDGFEYDQYLKLSNFNKEKLKEWAIAIDYDLYYLKFNESSEILNDLFFYNEKTEYLITEKNKIIKEKEELVKQAITKYAEIIEIKNLKNNKLYDNNLNAINLDNNNIKIIKIKREVVNFDYIGSKLARITHDLFKGARITIVESEDSIVIRADDVKFSLIKLIDLLKQKIPYALIEGGGHDFAGTIKFSALNKEIVIKEVYDYLKTNLI